MLLLCRTFRGQGGRLREQLDKLQERQVRQRYIIRRRESQRVRNDRVRVGTGQLNECVIARSMGAPSHLKAGRRDLCQELEQSAQLLLCLTKHDESNERERRRTKRV